jgi:2-keto-3-deoxy-6-phosphogluconate aldolase
MTLRQALKHPRVLAILRRPDIADMVVDLLERLHEAGVRAVEVTLDQADALEALRWLVERAAPDMVLGAGTVLTREQLDMVADAGASSAVWSHLDARLVERGLEAARTNVPLPVRKLRLQIWPLFLGCRSGRI